MTTKGLVASNAKDAEFENEDQGVVRLETGSCVHQPPAIRHRELGQSDDLELLEVVLPAGLTTEEVSSVNGKARSDSSLLEASS